ncbi:MAG TPA: GNAT family N-acetyltransferase [Acidimicrobiales bacterium]|nr:GNAT family N-acetyltransferase [Acidimicrobiales bacterium]
MAVTVRPIETDEVAAWVTSVSVPFLRPGPDDEADSEDRWRRALAGGTAWAAVDEGRFVGNCAIFPLELSLPAAPDAACPTVPMAGVTAVGVHPTHRRRGILRSLMGAMLEAAVANGQPVAGLYASEAVIYGRFGFGTATWGTKAALVTSRSAFAVPAPSLDIRLVGADEAAKLVPPVFDRARRNQPAEVSRTEGMWAERFLDRPAERHGRSGQFYALAETGYAIYRSDRRPDSDTAVLQVEDLCGETPEDEAALWRYLLDIDLVDEVVWWLRVGGEPLLHRLADPRCVRAQTVEDLLWVRVLDVPAAFTARGYRASGRLVVEVDPAPAGTGSGTADPAAGRWVVEAGPDGAFCRAARAGDTTDLRLGVAALGTLLAGGAAASVLAAAGRVREERAGAVAVADALFNPGRVTFCTTDF